MYTETVYYTENVTINKRFISSRYLLLQAVIRLNAHIWSYVKGLEEPQQVPYGKAASCSEKKEMTDESLKVFCSDSCLLCSRWVVTEHIPFLLLPKRSLYNTIPETLKISEICSSSSGEWKVNENIWKGGKTDQEKETWQNHISVWECKLALGVRRCRISFSGLKGNQNYFYLHFLRKTSLHSNTLFFFFFLMGS